MRLVFIKLNKPRQFEYKPLYYDQKKEEMQERLRLAGVKDDVPQNAIREKIRQKWHGGHDANKRRSVRGSLLVYLLAVVMLLYFIFFS